MIKLIKIHLKIHLHLFNKFMPNMELNEFKKKYTKFIKL